MKKILFIFSFLMMSLLQAGEQSSLVHSYLVTENPALRALLSKITLLKMQIRGSERNPIPFSSNSGLVKLHIQLSAAEKELTNLKASV